MHFILTVMRSTFALIIKYYVKQEIYLQFAGNLTFYRGARQIYVSRVEDVLTNYSLCDERRNHGHDSSCNSNLSIQVATVFALEPCDNLVWRTSQYFKNML